MRNRTNGQPAPLDGTPTVTLPFPRTPRYGPGERDAVNRLLDGGRLSDTGRGSTIAGFEDDFAAFVDTRHALSFSSGTASLHAALHAVGVGADAGIVTSPMTWISAILVAFHAGSFPIFCDIQPDGVNLDPAAVAAAGDSAAVLATHTWGIPARMDALLAATSRPIVEDCSHAHGARLAGRPVGGWARRAASR